MKSIASLFVGLLAVATLTSAQPVQSAFVPLAPCRLFDSRVDSGAPLQSGTTTYLLVRGACNVPISATAVAATVVAVDGAGPGHLIVWESSLPIPSASSMNFRGGWADSSYVTSRLCYPVEECATEDLAVYTLTTTHVIIDVVGYFAAIE